MNDTYERCRSLYRAARSSESSSEADRHAVRKALAAAVTAGVTSTAAGVSGAAVAGSGTVCGTLASTPAVGASSILHALAGGKVLGGVLIGAALGTALSTTVFVLVPALHTDAAAIVPRDTPPRAVTQRTRAHPLDPGQVTNSPASIAVQPSSATIQRPTSAQPAVQRATPRARAPVVFQVDPQPTTSDGLAEEAQALTEVHAALSRKDADLAWKLLQEQNHRFPSGQLGEERAAAKVMALCSAGRYDEADHAQAEFALTYPNSPLAKRVKRGCAP